MSKNNIYLYAIVVCFVFISNCFAGSDLPYKEDELIVKFAPNTNGKQKTVQEHNQILSSLNAGEVKHSVKLVPGLSLVKLPAGLTVTEALSKLKGKGEFFYVEPNYKIRIASTTPNDTYFGNLWGMVDINAPQAWDIIHDACDIIVAVIDTGVDYTHPDLAANMWVNEVELNGTTGVHDDGNGYVDDKFLV